MKNTVKFSEYDKTFLEKSWEWLNNPIIKKLTNTSDFTKEGQQSWFKSLKDKNTKFLPGLSDLILGAEATVRKYLELPPK